MGQHQIQIRGLLLIAAAIFAFSGAWTLPVAAYEGGPPPGGDEQRPADPGDHHGHEGHWRAEHKDHGGWHDRGRHGGWDDGKRRHHRGGRYGGAHTGPMTEQDIQDLLEVLADHRPELVDQVKEISEKDPQRVREMLGRHGYRLHRLVKMKRYHPEMYQIKTEDSRLWRRSEELAEQHRAAANQEQRDAVRAELQDVVERHFEVRQKMREARLAKFRERIERLQSRIQARADARQELIGERMADLTGDADQARW